MEDLISRKAVLDKFNRKADMYNALTDEETSKEFWLFCRVADALDTIPSVPAVPLDKLCEYLNSVIYPCIICKESPGPQCNAKRKGCWYKVLTKWMEEQDATD